MDNSQPIIIKKNINIEAGHHGGSWKVAYADFVTAMMAFFLLMWLLGSTTKEQKVAISDFFKSPSAIEASGGGTQTPIDMGGGLDAPKQSRVERIETENADQSDPANDEVESHLVDQRKLEDLRLSLQAAIEASKSLSKYQDQLLMDITTEGLRIQILDKENRSMFDVGSARLKWYTRAILNEVAKFVSTVPNRISISGHTDARAYSSQTGYTNWELSADRANAARRQLISGGMNVDKVIRVEGLASKVLFDPEDPLSPTNRRISIVVLNMVAEKEILKAEGAGPVELNEGGVSVSAPSAMPAPTERPEDAQSPADGGHGAGAIRRDGSPPPAGQHDSSRPPADAPGQRSANPGFINLPSIPGAPVAPIPGR